MEDIRIVADRLLVTGSGRILVNRTGGGRLILYIADNLELSGSARIQYIDSMDLEFFEQLNWYHGLK